MNYANMELNSIDKKWFGDMANIRIGPGRIRQVRVERGICITVSSISKSPLNINIRNCEKEIFYLIVDILCILIYYLQI